MSTTKDSSSSSAWVIDDTGFPKDGIASPGVARQYSGTLGKVGNCQVGVSVHAVTDAASCPLNWRLFLPASWDPAQAADDEAAEQVSARRAIPDGEHHRPKWQLAVEMLDELAAWGLAPPLVVADAGYGDNAHLRAALSERGLHVVQVKGKERSPPTTPPTNPTRSRTWAAAARPGHTATRPGRSACASTCWPPDIRRRKP